MYHIIVIITIICAKELKSVSVHISDLQEGNETHELL